MVKVDRLQTYRPTETPATQGRFTRSRRTLAERSFLSTDTNYAIAKTLGYTGLALAAGAFPVGAEHSNVGLAMIAGALTAWAIALGIHIYETR